MRAPLFIVLHNDITELPLKGYITLSADNTTLAETADLYEERERNTNRDLMLINEWLIKNGLIFNLNKCNYIVMGRLSKDLNLNIKVGENFPQKSGHNENIRSYIGSRAPIWFTYQRNRENY